MEKTMAIIKDTVIRTEGIFELREVEHRIGSWSIAGFVVWDTNAHMSSGPGIVPTQAEAEIVLDTALGSRRAQELTEARKIAGLPPTRVTGWC